MADRISGLVQVTSREPINHNMLETIQQMAHKILGFGCMPLVPSTRRNWDRDEILKLEGTTISWPPQELIIIISRLTSNLIVRMFLIFRRAR
jgi:hypothetical protein